MEAVAPFPWAIRVGQLFYKAMIYHLGPEIRHVPDSNYGYRLYGNAYRNVACFGEQLAVRAAKRLKRRLRGNTALIHPRGQSLSPAHMVRSDPELRRAMEVFLKRPRYDHGIFNRSGIRRILAEHYEEGVDHSTLILLLAMVHRSMEYFLYDTRSSLPSEVSAVDTSSLHVVEA
jgi:hypothetical protein